MDSNYVARSREHETQQKQNEKEGPANEFLASIMKNILCTGDLMAMTKLLSQKLKKSDNKDLLLSEIGRVEQMLLHNKYCEVIRFFGRSTS